jgi:hypothetical protein
MVVAIASRQQNDHYLYNLGPNKGINAYQRSIPFVQLTILTQKKGIKSVVKLICNSHCYASLTGAAVVDRVSEWLWMTKTYFFLFIFTIMVDCSELTVSILPKKATKQ